MTFGSLSEDMHFLAKTFGGCSGPPQALPRASPGSDLCTTGAPETPDTATSSGWAVAGLVVSVSAVRTRTEHQLQPISRIHGGVPHLDVELS